MRKAIRLKVILWIEGEDDPAHDFAKSTTQAVHDVIGAGIQKLHPPLQIAIKAISEADDEEGESQ